MKVPPIRRRELVVALGFWLGGGYGLSTLPAQEVSALALMEEISARYQELSGFCASFQQTLAVPLLGDTTVSRGSLCQAKPNLFAMRFSEPKGDCLVADGEYFWVYYPSSDPRQVLQFEMDVQPGGIDFHREFLESPGDRYQMSYVGEEMILGRSTRVVVLKPQEPAGFEEATLWLDPVRSLILQAGILMENGSVRTVTLSEIQIDPSEDPERFRFVPPEGARIIRR